MESFDIVFPLNLSPLTYSVPVELKGLVRPGQFVKAEIKNSVRVGLVIGRSLVPGEKLIKGLLTIDPIISEPILRLIKWMSDYYMINEGLVLKTMYSREFFEVLDDIPARTMQRFKGSKVQKCGSSSGKYQTLLFQVPTFEADFSLLSDLTAKESNIIVLCPERSHIERVRERLNPLLRERLSILHGDLSKKDKRQAFLSIISGQSDVVIGTRLAVFAPLRNVSHIVVLREEDDSYKNPQGMRFHGRDVAVMRGYLEKARVLLSSTAPSMESYYNAMKGKYRFVVYGGRIRGQKIEIIDMNRAQKVAAFLSKRVLEVARRCLVQGGRVLFLINRKGYSLIRCGDCDYVEGCDLCRVPLVYHKDKNLLLCHYCGRSFRVKDLCPACGGATLEAVGAGTQRIEAEIRRHLGITPLRLEKGIKVLDLARGSGIEHSVIVSTGVMKQLFPHRFFKACIFMNSDIHLQFPDFRSGEHLFQELQNMRGWVEPEGYILVQTRFPENHVYKAFKGSLKEFYETELSMRKSLLYPPFSRLATVTVTSDERDKLKALEEGLNSVEELINGSLSESNKGKSTLRLVIKSTSKRRLHEALRDLLTLIGDKKGIKITVDVDPLRIS